MKILLGADESRPPRQFQKKKRENMANTKAVEDVLERKKIKRAARKKAAPKGPRAGARGENKQKLKKAARGQSKRK
jgi:hypothetical protein